MKIPDSVIAEIERKINILDIAGQYTTLTNKGGRFTGLCPFHNEKSPSFSVTPEKNLYYCFGCQKGGSLFNFVMEKEGLSFPESVKFLAQKAGVQITWEEGGSQEAASQNAALLELYDRLSKTFHFLFKNVDSASSARTYLVGREVPEESVDSFMIGYCPGPSGWLFDFLRGKNYSAEFLATSGLFSKNHPSYCLFHNRLMFPIFNVRSQCIGFGGRSLDGSEPKYINSPETPIFIKKHNLFGLDKALPTIKQKGFFILVEGYMDAVALHQAGWANTVAPLGTAFTPEQAKLLKRYCSEGRLLFDNDKAGQAATEKAMIICENHQMESSVILLSGGKDPAEILQKEGQEALNKLLEYNINSFDYLTDVLTARFGKDSAGQKIRCIAAARDYYISLQSAVKKEDFVRKLADALDVEERNVARDIQKGPALRSVEAENDVQQKPSLFKGELKREQVLMLVLTANREYFPYARSHLNPDDLKDGTSRSLFYILEDSFRNEDESDEAFWERFDQEDLRSAVLEKLTSGEYHVKDQSLIDDLLIQLQMEKIVQERFLLGKNLKKAEKDGLNDLQLREFVAQKMYLDSEYERLKVSIHDGTAKRSSSN